MRFDPLVVDSGADAAADITAYVIRLARDGSLTRRQSYLLRLAADEITTNIAVHGYRGSGGPLLLVSGCDPERVWLCIEDEAPPFDPRTHDAAPRLAEGITGGREGGFGLFLALNGLDEFRYEHTDGRNRNTLIMLRERSPAIANGDGDQDADKCRADRH